MEQQYRKDIDDLISAHGTRVRDDFDDRDLEVFVRGLLVAVTGTWEYSALTRATHLYRDVRWTQADMERFRLVLERVFRVELPPWEFLCCRTVGCLVSVLCRALDRERRHVSGSAPAA